MTSFLIFASRLFYDQTRRLIVSVAANPKAIQKRIHLEEPRIDILISLNCNAFEKDINTPQTQRPH